MPSRLFAALIACLLLLAGLAPAAGAAEPGFERTEHKIKVVDGPPGERFEITIDASLYTPNGVSKANPAPVVINAHGFNGSKETNDNGMNQLLAKAGYVVFAYSSRGFGATDGKIGLDSVHYDVKDVRQLIDWLAQRPEIQRDGRNDPRLGMVGPSYGGGIQLQVAGVDDRVDVLVPYITWHSLVSSLSPNYLNTDLRLQEGRPIGVFKEQWTSLFFGSGNGQVLTSPPGTGVPLPCPNFVEPLCRIYTESVLAGRATPETVEILKTASPATQPRLGNIDIPTLLIQGQADTLFTVNEAAANYTAIKANGAPVKMIWFDGGHGYPYAEGELEFLQQRTLAWFDRHLSGLRGVQTGPGFEYYRNYVESKGAAAYAAAPRYPVGKPTTLFLSADQKLVSKAGDATAGDISFLSPGAGAPTSYSETSNFQNNPPFQSIPARDAPDTFAAFTTEPLAADTTVVGIPTVRFKVSSLTGEAQLFAKLYDVAPDGSTKLVRRLVAPLRATDLDGTLSAQLVGIAHRFAKDHSIRLVFAATDAAYANERVPSEYTMNIEPGEATLSLPLVGSETTTKPGNAVGRTVTVSKTVRGGPEGGGPASGGAVAVAGTGTAPTLPATGSETPALLGVALLAGAALLHRRPRRP